MDLKGKNLMVEEEEKEENILQIGIPELAHCGDLKMENRKEDASKSILETNSFAQIPSFPKPVIVPPAPTPELNPLRARFLFQKELKSSDVGHARRIIIPKAPAMSYFPHLTSGDGIFLYMDDMINAPLVWVFRFRYWQNSNSRMYVLEKTGDFVRTHGLGVGDIILFYKDEQTERYGIQAMMNPNKQNITPMDGEKELMNCYGNFLPSNEMDTHIYPQSNMQNYMMNFLGGPDLTVPNAEQSTSFDPANVYPYYYF